MFKYVKNPMTKTECLEWIEALRSDKFKQGQNEMIVEILLMKFLISSRPPFYHC